MGSFGSSNVRKNIVANFLGKAVAVVTGLFFPPFFARRLGIESYGLVGLFGSLIAVLGILDFGLSQTFTREIARLSTEDSDAANQEIHDIVVTLGLVFWCVGLITGGAIFLAAPWAPRWLHSTSLPHSTIVTAFRAMGMVFALQWPCGAYASALLGLQRHGTYNGIQVIGGLAKNVVAALAIIYLARSVTTFFVCQAIGSLALTLVTMWVAHRCLPGRIVSGRIRRSVISKNWKFSAGISVLTLLSLPLMQGDKFIVSLVLTLKDVGYYSLAWTVGNSLMMLVGPVCVSVYPRMAQLAKQELSSGVRELYRTSCQLVSAVMFPASVVLLLYRYPILLAWTRDMGTTNGTLPIVGVVVVGTMLYQLMFVPMILQLSYGWTGLAIKSNVIAVVLYLPLTYVLAKNYGCVGAASTWIVLNTGYVLLQIPLIHRRLLPGVTRDWYIWDVLLPFVGALFPALLIRQIVPMPSSRLGTLGASIVAGTLAFLGSVLCSSRVRPRVASEIKSILRSRLPNGRFRWRRG